MCVRERERERQFLLCRILLYSQRKEEHPKPSGGFSLRFRLFFCLLLLSLWKKKSEISLGFRVHLSHSEIRGKEFYHKSPQRKRERETERERERDFAARETERER